MSSEIREEVEKAGRKVEGKEGKINKKGLTSSAGATQGQKGLDRGGEGKG